MNPIVEIDKKGAIDVRAIYMIDELVDSQYDPYYSIHFIDGHQMLVPHHAFPREKLIQIWRDCVAMNPEVDSDNRFRRVVL